MSFFEQRSGCRWTATALVILFLCICSSRVDPCWGEDNRDNDNDKDATKPMASIPSTRANRFPSVATRVKLYMSNWYTPPCQGDNDAFVRYALSNDIDSSEDSNGAGATRRWPTLRVEGYKDHPIVNQTTRILNNITSVVEVDTLFFMDQETIFNCGNYSYNETWANATMDPYLQRVFFRHNMRMYCEDVEQLLVPAWRHLRLLGRSSSDNNNGNTDNPPPTLLQFGDNKRSHVYKNVNVPHIKKFRSASLDPHDLKDVTSEQCYSSSTSTPTPKSDGSSETTTGILRTALNAAHGNHMFQPIVWKLATNRHYRKLGDVYRYDTQWSHKSDMAVFKGQLTGTKYVYDKHATDTENCLNLKRCRLVYNHANSTLIDAKLTSTRGRLPDVLEGVELVGEMVKINALLEYKGLIMIEGNDVASGLKWALLSQSVVLMPIPKHTSWCMEELLEPWVHYVPLDENATDVEEKMRWVVDHDEDARRISERATLWMEDLVFHPDAPEDDRMIQEEILRRYEAHFLEAQK